MSGHSKWHSIKHKKGLTDKKKGALFSKLTRIIQIAARDGGDPGANFKLRLAVDKAKAANLPNDKIDNAIKKGTGEDKEGAKLESVTYEAYGPEGIAIIIEGTTDNKSRTTAEIKHVLSKNGGRLGEPGSVLWSFEKKGVITIKNDDQREAAELAAIDAGAEDIKDAGEFLEILTKPQDLGSIKDQLSKQKILIDSASVDLIPQNPVKAPDDKVRRQVEKIMSALDESEDVSEIYSNLED